MTRLSCHTPAPHVPDDEPFWPARNWAHLIAYFQEKVKAHLWWEMSRTLFGCVWLANCHGRADFTGNRAAQVNWLSLSERVPGELLFRP
jgi:hypothetical protein